jgi:hypothetical protein
MTQEYDRILILEEAVAGLLRRFLILEARISELEKFRRGTALIPEKKANSASTGNKGISSRISARPYTWSDLRKTRKSFV